jgi:hypothetical protein
VNLMLFKISNEPQSTYLETALQTRIDNRCGFVSETLKHQNKDNPLHFSPEDLDGGVPTDLEPVTGLLTRLRTVNLNKDKIITH